MSSVTSPLGALSFPLYLVQEPCIQIARAEIANAAIWKAAAVSFSINATAILYLCVDAPIEKWRKRFVEDFRSAKTAYSRLPR